MFTKQLIIMKTKNFRKKLSIACSTDDLRPVLQCVYFDEGYAVATDVHLIVKQSLREHNFNEAEIEIMNGKFLHKDAFNKIYQYDNVTVSEEGFNCIDKKNKISALIRFTETEDKFPNYKPIFDMGATREVEEIGLKGVLLKKLNDISLSFIKTYKFQFYGKNKGIKIIPTDLTEADECIILMPVMINL